MPREEMEPVLRRLEALEAKVDVLVRHMERATGAWLFLKVMGALAIGTIAVATFISNQWKLWH